MAVQNKRFGTSSFKLSMMVLEAAYRAVVVSEAAYRAVVSVGRIIQSVAK